MIQRWPELGVVVGVYEGVLGSNPGSYPSARCETTGGERDRHAVIGSKGERNMYSSYRDRKHLNCMETAKEVIFYSNLDNANV